MTRRFPLAFLAVLICSWGCEDSSSGERGPEAEPTGEGEGEPEGGEEGGPGEEGEGEPGQCGDERLLDANCAEVIDCARSCAGEGCAEACVACGIRPARVRYQEFTECVDESCDGDYGDDDCVCGSCRAQAEVCGQDGPCVPVVVGGCLDCDDLMRCVGEAQRDPREEEKCFDDACDEAKVSYANRDACISRCEGDLTCETEGCDDLTETCRTADPEEDAALLCGGMFSCTELYCVIPGGVNADCIIWCQGELSMEELVQMQAVITCMQNNGCVSGADESENLACADEHCAREFAECFNEPYKAGPDPAGEGEGEGEGER